VGQAIASSVVRGRKEDAVMSIMGLDTRDEVEIPERRFQWWPATLTDSIAIGWQEKSISGASHGIMQWTANGGRSIGFQIKLSREMRYPDDFSTGKVPPGARLLSAAASEQTLENVNIPLMIRYLRAYCYPEYTNGLAEPPVVAVVNIPGSEIDENGNDYFFGVMTTCDVNRLKAFPDGRPRLVEVSLNFKQVVQGPSGVSWKSRKDLLGAKKGREQRFSEKNMSLPPFTGGLAKKVKR
jgi:hypothetical protein